MERPIERQSKRLNTRLGATAFHYLSSLTTEPRPGRRVSVAAYRRNNLYIEVRKELRASDFLRGLPPDLQINIYERNGEEWKEGYVLSPDGVIGFIQNDEPIIYFRPYPSSATPEQVLRHRVLHANAIARFMKRYIKLEKSTD